MSCLVTFALAGNSPALAAEADIPWWEKYSTIETPAHDLDGYWEEIGQNGLEYMNINNDKYIYIYRHDRYYNGYIGGMNFLRSTQNNDHIVDYIVAANDCFLSRKDIENFNNFRSIYIPADSPELLGNELYLIDDIKFTTIDQPAENLWKEFIEHAGIQMNLKPEGLWRRIPRSEVPDWFQTIANETVLKGDIDCTRAQEVINALP